MWVLILTTMMSVQSSLAGYGAVSSHIHHIDGFTSESTCKVAGKNWLQYAKHDSVRKSAICVKLSGEMNELQ